MVYLSACVVLGQYFDRRLPLATGISMSGAGIGMFVFGPLTQLLIDHFTWHGAMLAFAGMVLHFCILGATFIPVPRKQARKATKICDVSLLTDIRYALFCFSQFVAVIGKVIDLIIHDSPTLFIGYYVPFTFLVEVAHQQGIDKFQAAFLVSIIGIVNCIGRLIAGSLVNMKVVNHFVLFIGACIIGGAANIACAHLHSYGALAAFCAVYGCFTGGYFCNQRFILIFFRLNCSMLCHYDPNYRCEASWSR